MKLALVMLVGCIPPGPSTYPPSAYGPSPRAAQAGAGTEIGSGPETSSGAEAETAPWSETAPRAGTEPGAASVGERQTAEPAGPVGAGGTSRLVGIWFQGSAGADYYTNGTLRASSGQFETWKFDADGRFEHLTYMASGLSCNQRFMTRRAGRYQLAGDRLALATAESTLTARGDCDGTNYQNPAAPEPPVVTVQIEAHPTAALLTLVRPDGSRLADQFAEKR